MSSGPSLRRWRASSSRRIGGLAWHRTLAAIALLVALPLLTVRPAAQTILGRIRGGWLALVIFFKLNLFGWLLFAWVGMGAAWSVQYDNEATQQ